MKEKKHSTLARITACCFIVLILGSYFNFLYLGFGGESPSWVIWLYRFGLVSVILCASVWLASFLIVYFSKFFD